MLYYILIRNLETSETHLNLILGKFAGFAEPFRSRPDTANWATLNMDNPALYPPWAQPTLYQRKNVAVVIPINEHISKAIYGYIMPYAIIVYI